MSGSGIMVQSFLVKDEGRPLSLKKIAGHRGVQEKDYGPDKHRTSTVQDADKIKLLKYCREARLLKEMMSFMELKHRETFMNN